MFRRLEWQSSSADASPRALLSDVTVEFDPQKSPRIGLAHIIMRGHSVVVPGKGGKAVDEQLGCGMEDQQIALSETSPTLAAEPGHCPTAGFIDDHTQASGPRFKCSLGPC